MDDHDFRTNLVVSAATLVVMLPWLLPAGITPYTGLLIAGVALMIVVTLVGRRGLAGIARGRRSRATEAATGRNRQPPGS